MKTKENPEMPMVPKAYLKTVEHQRDQYKSERDSLIDDIEAMRRKNKDLAQENKALRLQANTYFDEWQSVKNLYTTLTNHIRLKAENNPGVSRYINLVNYIDRLERD